MGESKRNRSGCACLDRIDFSQKRIIVYNIYIYYRCDDVIINIKRFVSRETRDERIAENVRKKVQLFQYKI